MRPTLRTTAVVACLWLALAPAVTASDLGVHALTDARIVIAPGQVIESGTLVVRDGVITAVGADVTPPADARIWELEGLTLFPGLIESFHLQDVPQPEGDDAPTPQAGHPNALVHPERDMLQHAVDANSWKKLRGAGFTSAVIVPEPGLFRGRSVLVNLNEGPIHSAVVRRDVAQNAHLRTNNFGNGYPVSLMGAVALFRQTLHDAQWHTTAHAAYDKRPAQARPDTSIALEALANVARGEEQIVLQARDTDDILRLGRLAEEFELDAVVVGTGGEYRWLDEIAATGMPILLPVDLPKAPEVGDDDTLDTGLDALRHWDQAPENPQRLSEAGVQFALTSHGLLDPKKVHPNVHRVIERGFDRDAALAAFTTVPAKMLGVDDRLGSLAVGKIANIVVAEGDLFVEQPKLRSVWVDGQRYELKNVKPPSVEPIGTWSLVIDAGPGGQIPVKVVLTGSVDNLSGNLLGAGGALPLEEAYVSDKTVHFAFNSTPIGMPGTITFAMIIDGEAASGTGTSPQGNFTFTGERTERPDPEGSR